MTPPAAMMPPSPAPLAPSGLIGEGRIFQHDGADVREVAGGRDKIVGERAGEELALLVVDEMLHHGTAQPLHRRADGLAVHRQRIDDAAAILDDDIVDELDVTELGVDRHMGGMGAVGVGVLLVEEGAFGRDAVGRKPFQRDRFAAGPNRLGAFDDLDLGGLSSRGARRPARGSRRADWRPPPAWPSLPSPPSVSDRRRNRR